MRLTLLQIARNDINQFLTQIDINKEFFTCDAEIIIIINIFMYWLAALIANSLHYCIACYDGTV